MKILARLKKKFGGRLEEIELPKHVADLIPTHWEFCSKIQGIPKELSDSFTMLYRVQ